VVLRADALHARLERSEAWSTGPSPGRATH